jgi:hypothetical protein
MSSERQLLANRANARRSTGARTRQGKARARRNALRHGLAASTLKNSAISADVERLATIIAGDDANPSKFEQASIIAETELTLVKIRAIRAGLINDHASDLALELPPGQALQTEPAFLQVMPVLLKLGRYERRAFSRRKRAMRDYSRLPST